jgi:UDP-GlcNAc:undecaprenyl-phosphate GlcNAc-1-phosphate transferase
MDLLTFLPIFVLSFIATVLFTPWVGKLAQIFDVIQYPPSEHLKRLPETGTSKKVSATTLEAKIIAARRRLEKHPMANWGGIAYITPFLIISISTLLLSKTINIAPEEVNNYILWFFGIIILFVMGVIDDKFELTGKTQILFQMLAAFLFILSPIDLDFLTNPFTGMPLIVRISEFTVQFGGLLLSISFPGDIVLFIWILVLINAIKWQGGTDALMEGNVFIALVIIFIVSFMFTQPASALFSITLAGTLLGFIVYNFYPAKIMSASAGKTVVGFIVATLAIISNAKFAISLIVFAIPLIDMFWVLVKRIIDYKPKSLFQLLLISDRSHFHHKLMKLGLNEPQIAIFEYTITAVLGCLAIFLQGTQKTIFVVIAWVLVFLIILYVSLKTNGKR